MRESKPEVSQEWRTWVEGYAQMAPKDREKALGALTAEQRVQFDRAWEILGPSLEEPPLAASAKPENGKGRTKLFAFGCSFGCLGLLGFLVVLGLMTGSKDDQVVEQQPQFEDTSAEESATNEYSQRALCCFFNYSWPVNRCHGCGHFGPPRPL